MAGPESVPVATAMKGTTRKKCLTYVRQALVYEAMMYVPSLKLRNPFSHSFVTDAQDQRRKRARISAGKQPAQASANHEASDPSSDEDSDADARREPEGHSEFAATQYDLMRDAGFKHLAHADEDDKRATQRLQQKGLSRQSNRADAVMNRAFENGILESIQCLNFMCHDNLHVELGPLLNFIVGENGSGKSAILTAITLCLGGKASSTNRGGSLKSFIKEGKEKSILIVKLKNKGHDAYQHEIYGDTILVERHFSRTGSSGFYVKSETGRTISTKKRDVDEIVEYYSLQVDNPLNVLSQDNARQFLNAASAKQKYRFFVQGVQMQQLDDDYRVIEEYLNANQHKQDDLETKVAISQKEYEKAKKDFNLLQESDKMRDEVTLLRQKLLWAQVVEKERELKEYVRLLDENDQAIAETQADFESRTEALDRHDQQIAKLQEDVDALKEENETLTANKDQARVVYDTAKKELATLQNDQRDARGKLQSAEKECRNLEQKIKDEERRLEEANGNTIIKRNQELEAARAKLDQTKEKLEDTKKQEPGLNQKLDQAKVDCQKVDQSIDQKKKDIQSTQSSIREIVAGQGSLYDAYHPKMRSLLQMIDKDTGFERKPVGPMGAHIQVLQPMWSPMLERLFGDNLNGFVVVSKRDQLRLSGMMKNLGMNRSPILIGNASPIDTSRHEPDELYATILRILRIEDPLIRNQLIINHRIETTILVQSKEDADRIMLGSARPQNVTACYHPHRGKGHGWTVRLSVTANGANSSPQSPPQGPSRLKSDSLQEKALLEERLGQFQAELKDLQQQKNQQQHSYERCKQEIHECKRSVERLSQERINVQAEIGTIQGELDAFDGVDARLNGLRTDLVSVKEDFEQYSNEYGTIGLRRDEKNKEVEQLHNALKAEANKLKTFELKLGQAENKVQRAQDSREIAVAAKNQAYDNNQMAKNRKLKYEGKRENLQDLIADWTERARTQCERVEIWESETGATIEKKLKSMEKALQEREKKRGMTDDEVRQRAQQAKAAYDSLRKAFNQVGKENHGLKATLVQRLEKWRTFQRYISSNSRSNFMYLLSERDFRGRLILDHINHTLEVQVEPDKTRKNEAARNTKTLSGGEKSFSSICLLLAIWEAMGSPLRCLDEFDVFMDSVNREISTDMLVRYPFHPNLKMRVRADCI